MAALDPGFAADGRTGGTEDETVGLVDCSAGPGSGGKMTCGEFLDTGVLSLSIGLQVKRGLWSVEGTYSTPSARHCLIFLLLYEHRMHLPDTAGATMQASLCLIHYEYNGFSLFVC